METKKIEKRFEIFQNSADKEATIYLHGVIRDSAGWWDDGEIITPKNVREALAGIDTDTDTINIHINSYGGSAFASIAIYNMLKQHNASINVYIDGIAASGASIISMAGKKVYMPKNTLMMIHNAWTFTWGNAKQLRKEADDLEKLDSALRETYKAHFIGTDDELCELLNNETYLTADECLTLGLCTDVIEVKENDSDDEKAESKKNEILSKYSKTPNNEKPKSGTGKEKAVKAMEAFFAGLNKKMEV